MEIVLLRMKKFFYIELCYWSNKLKSEDIHIGYTQSLWGSDEVINASLDPGWGHCSLWRLYGLRYVRYPVKIDFGALAMVDEESQAVERLFAVFKPFSLGWWQIPWKSRETRKPATSTSRELWTIPDSPPWQASPYPSPSTPRGHFFQGFHPDFLLQRTCYLSWQCLLRSATGSLTWYSLCNLQYSQTCIALSWFFMSMPSQWSNYISFIPNFSYPIIPFPYLIPLPCSRHP